MSLHFIFGRAGTGKSHRVCGEIRDYVEGGPGRTAYLIVPDQNTYTAESMLASLFPGHGFTSVDVCGFSRFAYHIFRELHAPVQDALSTLGQELIIERLLREHGKELKMLGRAAAEPHFATELAGLFRQFELFTIREEDLFRAEEAEGETPLGRKLHDTALLYKAYHDYLRVHFQYEGSLFDLLAKELPRSPSVKNSRIWIDGFNGLAPQKIQIVDALLKTAREVTITLQMDPPEQSVSNPNFARPYRLYSQLSEKEGHSDALILTRPWRFKSPALQALAGYFFNTGTPARPAGTDGKEDPGEGIHVITASNKAEEIDFIARRIKTLVRSGSFRYRDILVFLRTPENYTDLIERTFKKYRIPAFIDKTHLMNNHPLVLLLLHVLRFLTKEGKGRNSWWGRETIFNILKTNLIPSISAEETDRLENYVLKYGVRQWHTPWAFRDHFDLDEEERPLSEKERQQQEKANLLREQVVSLLDPLAEDWKNAKTAKEKCTVLYQWLIAQKIPDTLSRWDQEEFSRSRTMPHQQVWKKVMSLLDEIVHVAGEDPLKEETLFSVFQDGLSALSYSLIPPTLDHVTVTGINRGYAMEGKVVIIPGVLEGEFPKRISEDGFFTESEKQELKENSHLEINLNLMDRIHEEEFYTYLALTRASRALYLTYPAVKDDGGEAEPSFLLKQMNGAGYVSDSGTVPGPDGDFPDHSFFDNPDQALSLLPEVLRQRLPAANSDWSALRSWAVRLHPEYKTAFQNKMRGMTYENRADPLPEDLAARLFMPEKRFYASVTRLENYRNCPYQFFLRYGLHVEEREDGTMDARDFGSYLHAGLHQFGSVLRNRRKHWRDVSDEELKNLSASIAGALAPRVKSGALHADGASRFTERSLNQSFQRTLLRLRQWSRASDFNPEALEKEFIVHIKAGLHDSLTLTGKIDRIDSYRNAFAIFDYKTGNTSASLSEIVSGLKLQLMTYLLAVLKNHPGGGLIPTALMYIYLHNDIVNTAVPRDGKPDITKQHLTSGYVLNDPELLQKLDHDIAGTGSAGEAPHLLNIRLNKNGTLKKSNSLLSREELEALLEKTEEEIVELYHQIKSGKIAIRPAYYGGRSPCPSCPYRSICRFDPALPNEGYDFITKKSDGEVRKELAPQAGKKEEQ